MTRKTEHGTWISRKAGLLLQVEPWGPDAARVRATMSPELPPDTEVLLPPPAAEPQWADKRLANGRLVVDLDPFRLTFRETGTDRELLAQEPMFHCHGYTNAVTGAFTSRGGGRWRIEADFKAYAGERLYGMGQHRHGRLDQKGCVLDLYHHNCEVNIPFLLSSRGYGFIWNNPAVGRAEFGHNRTRWVAEQSAALDYVVIAGETPAAILERYTALVGRAPELPEWASGFWQCKLRYENREQLLAVAREHKRRGLPMDVIVIDFLHWPNHGDWKLDPQDWPDPAAMVRELRAMGIRVMASVWPTVTAHSENFHALFDGGMLVHSERGLPAHLCFQEGRRPGPIFLHLADPTNPDTRRFVWEKIRANYCAHGIKVFWLDAIEPELMSPAPHLDNLRYHAGNALETAGLYPWYQQKLFHDGMRGDGEKDVVTLGRSGFLGSQRFGAAIWNGDIPSTFEALAASIRGGLNIGLSGIPWWTTDIGGFYGGDTSTEYFRELIVRWFQYGAFCPLFRLHGVRGGTPTMDNEVWSFGERAYGPIVEMLRLRERLRPYIHGVMREAARTGMPPMRPLFLAFPDDGAGRDVEDQYLFGPDLLVCPVTAQGATSRTVYLPAGATWTDAWSGRTLEGGQTLTADAPLDRIPLYLRDGAQLPIRG